MYHLSGHTLWGYSLTLRIQSPSEDSHYHDESVIGPPNHHVTMGLDP